MTNWNGIKYLMILLVAHITLKVTWAQIASDQAEIITANYNKVRRKEAVWCTVVYEGNRLISGTFGDNIDALGTELKDDNRVYCYVRFGDKHYFITWIGPKVRPLKKARVSTDKAFVKNIFKQYMVEYLIDDKAEFTEKINQLKASNLKRNILLDILKKLLEEKEASAKYRPSGTW